MELKFLPGKSQDLTGRDRLSSNVIYSWGSQIVFVITGFIMPRLIDQHVGQFSLGIWDFCWSIVNYLNLASLGVGSSINRYVARHRANSDIIGLRESVSSVMCIQLIIAVFVLLSTATITWLMPLLFGNQLGAEMDVTRWVVALLGSGLAFQMAFDSSRGVMTGCHRWDLHNGIHAGSHVISMALMILVLNRGGGLRDLGLVHLSVVIVTEIFRTYLAHRICPELQVKLSYIKWPRAKEMLLFGSKTIVAGLPQLLTIQITNIIVVSALGPAALAVFSRPVALVRHVETFMNKFAFVLTPMAGSLQTNECTDELRQFFLETSRYGVALTLPILLFLVFFGDTILNLWMGDRYTHGIVLAILAIGYFLPISQNSAIRILMGLNMHGRISIINLAATFTIFIIGSLTIHAAGWTISNAAILISVSLTAGNGLIVPIMACRRLNIPFIDYLKNTFTLPVSCGVVFAAWLIISRIPFSGTPLTALAIAIAGGGAIITTLYFRYLLPDATRAKILDKISRKQHSSRLEGSK